MGEGNITLITTQTLSVKGVFTEKFLLIFDMIPEFTDLVFVIILCSHSARQCSSPWIMHHEVTEGFIKY